MATSIFAMTAFVLMWVGSVGCHFIEFKDTNANSPDDVNLEFGIWYYRQFTVSATTDGTSYVADRCHGYPASVDIDGSWKAARAFSVLAEIFGVCLILINFITACASFTTHTVSVGGWDILGYVLTGTFQGLTLLFLNSNACENNPIVNELNDPSFPETCSLSTGAKCVVAATFFWFISAFTSMQMDIERSRLKHGYARTAADDGSTAASTLKQPLVADPEV